MVVVALSGCDSGDASSGWTYPNEGTDEEQLTALVERYEQGLEAQDADVLCEDVFRFDVAEHEQPSKAECTQIWTDVLQREEISDLNYEVTRIRFPPNRPVAVYAMTNGEEEKLPQFFYEAEGRWWIRPFS